MKKSFIFFTLLFVQGALVFGQAPSEYDSAPAEVSTGALDATFGMSGFMSPGSGGAFDYLIFVDGDDPFVTIGRGLTGENSNGTHIGQSEYINPPPGASNEFIIVYYDDSEDLYHILNDPTSGNTLRVPFVEGVQQDQVEGFENVAGMDPFPGAATPALPGVSTFAELFVTLPVNFAAFSGQYGNKSVQLQWVTASESGNSHFTVQRSMNGADFKDVGQVEGAGDSETALSYNFQDLSPEAGVNYYRLRQDDFDGAFSFSGVITVEVSAQSAAQVRVWPNPAQDFLSVTLDESWSTQVEARLIDQSGRTVSNWSQTPGVSHSVDVGDVPVGIYQLVLTSGKQTKTERIVLR